MPFPVMGAFFVVPFATSLAFPRRWRWILVGGVIPLVTNAIVGYRGITGPEGDRAPGLEAAAFVAVLELALFAPLWAAGALAGASTRRLVARPSQSR